MKKIKFCFFLIASVLFLNSCSEDDRVFLDVTDPANSIAQFNTGEILVINPSADTQNSIIVGVSTISDSDRVITISVDASSTLDPSFYQIESLTPVIPAGQVTGEVIVTTFATDIFPDGGDALVLNLESVEGATILDSSVSQLSVGTTVECPSVDIAAVIGDGANVLANEILTGGFGAPLSAGGLTRSVLAGPGENQVTIVGGVGFNGSQDLVLNIDPDTGAVSYGGEDNVTFFENAGTPIPYTTVTGQALTCIGLIDIEIAAPFAAPFNANTFTIQF
ncbi:hypothetical protein GWK08_16050 [Leptobacterium flavescens]|uniref:DUF1735 domain-containing protein n=1 Tax=Leptobacterium flavescens TaxID=472055 RepID=A0A6P0UR36_9FLAO|nr:DUF1735 domain-containing protein [Leptobacterium flavescens]NER14970.1 hypothetical protein [Leptobacterium flavescens]